MLLRSKVLPEVPLVQNEHLRITASATLILHKTARLRDLYNLFIHQWVHQTEHAPYRYSQNKFAAQNSLAKQIRAHPCLYSYTPASVD